MFVYRVENNDGRGPYQGNWVVRYKGHKYTSSDLGKSHGGIQYPNIYEDDLSVRKECFCACPSKAKICQWFNFKWRSILHLADYHVGVYKISIKDVLFGSSGKQVMFVKNNSKYIKSMLLEGFK